jgi:plasmid stabilization system protein ParE
VSLYRLTPSAIDDIDQAISYLASQAGWNIAIKIEQELFDTFQKLSDFPGLGHRRPDLTPLPLHFFPSEPYLIVYQRDTNPLIIHAVLHGARDAATILSER